MEANDIIMRIARTIAPESFEEDSSEGYTGGKSAYYSSDLGVVTRVTNHKAYHRTFQQRATKFGLPSRIISIVFPPHLQGQRNRLVHRGSEPCGE